jgi:hypothetical protein
MASELCTSKVSTSPIHCPSIARHRPTLLLLVVALAWLVGPCVTNVRAQSIDDDPLHAIGIPPLSGQIPVQNGFINVATGNLHLEFPLGSIPQRGGLSLQVTLTYDSNIWKGISLTDGWDLRTSFDGGS